MQQAFPKYDEKGRPQDRYANSSSARRAYNKIVRGETSAKRFEKRGGLPRAVNYITKGKLAGTRVGGGMAGIWRVDYTYDYVDPNTGEEKSDARSFIARSTTYTSMEDIPYLKAVLYETVTEHAAYWREVGSTPVEVYNVEIDVVPVRKYTVSKEQEQAGGTWGTSGQRVINFDNLDVSRDDSGVMNVSGLEIE
jgi:hypothetical protein